MFATLIAHRHLVRELIVQDLRSRYVGSLVGFLWTVINPLVLLSIYTFVAHVFSWRSGGDSSTGAAAARIFAGLLPWLAFQEGIQRSTASFLENSNLIKKLRFPLEALPFKTVWAGLIQQLVGTLILILFLLLSGGLPFSRLLLLPALLLTQMLACYGLGTAAAALNVFFRDIAQTLGILFLALFWGTPIVYERPESPLLSQILSLNPLTHLIESYQWIFLGAKAPSLTGVVYWTAFSLASVLLGAAVLKRTRKDLVDFL